MSQHLTWSHTVWTAPEAHYVTQLEARCHDCHWSVRHRTYAEICDARTRHERLTSAEVMDVAAA
jgi:hypothetical protein